MNALARPADVRPDTLPLQTLQLTPREQAEGVMSAEHRELAAAILAFRGYVILKDALRPEFVERLRAEVAEIYADCRSTLDAVETDGSPDAVRHTYVSGRKGATFWFRKSRWRIFPRLTGIMGSPELLANAFVMPVLEQLLGPGFYCKYVSSDTCVKGAMLQSPHSDIDQDRVIHQGQWRPRGFIVNVPIAECGLHNGPTEVWPGGSHMWSSGLFERFGLAPYVQDGRNPPVERLAEYFPSVKVTLQPGEILVRDLSMWHRGTPSGSEQPRTLLTTAYFRAGYEYFYGDASYNLDPQLYRELDPRVRGLFQHHFSLAHALRLARHRVSSAVGRRAKALFTRGS
ncbi:phytanoyl-CoA dioxygenase family protein [Aggregicoccus sp. 17bor-14]|uniref:phytanoyl-CoA dioxygenase family protein n=1 Tax=Myxococcaceae TaxID=31 RepID=UPI00129CBDF2|nr:MULTISPECIES: phytanoyl-CoA dioxygenase family protein [Myxococcaceae]MBF5043668.1 phytanoyl-CoA dioxygenase family protein [Simulacricoccus sp. 17bor-14]MRI89426.1 phytanoyl-CoA dioxygenase family protein [Aggregicoccus sp. 17bor-14]